MRRSQPTQRGLLLLTLAVFVGCRNSEAAFPDSGVAEDVAQAVDPDAGVVGLDAVVASNDATPSADDAAIAVNDAAASSDGGDAGAPLDAGPARDAGSGLAPLAGDLVIVEVQGNPQNVADDQAEYIELLNVSGRDLDLQGCRITHRLWSGTGMAPVQSVGNHSIGRSVPVRAGARVMLTRSGGGYFGSANRDYVYAGFELSNGGNDNNRLRIMAPRWDGREPPSSDDVVDELVAPVGTFDNALRGRAWQIDPMRVPNPTAASNDDPAMWCHARATAARAYWSDNWGTPGAANACD